MIPVVLVILAIIAFLVATALLTVLEKKGFGTKAERRVLMIMVIFLYTYALALLLAAIF